MIVGHAEDERLLALEQSHGSSWRRAIGCRPIPAAIGTVARGAVPPASTAENTR
jgi:hypothetical protein